MTKDLEWLKEMVWEARGYAAVMTDDVGNISTAVTAVSVNEVIDLINQLDEPEVLSQGWIDEHEYIRMDPDNPFVYVKDLQNLLVPKQGEQDRAYKDGYEKGKQHATEKQSEETETVAEVLVDYLIASAKLKLALKMEVEELNT